MYEELVKTLHHCVATMNCATCPVESIDKEAKAQQRCVTILLAKAADAIEVLAAHVRQIEELRKDGYYLQKTKMMTYGQAIMTQPLPEPPKGE